jgi:hypothetical protein
LALASHPALDRKRFFRHIFLSLLNPDFKEENKTKKLLKIQ